MTANSVDRADRVSLTERLGDVQREIVDLRAGGSANPTELASLIDEYNQVRQVLNGKFERHYGDP